MNELVSNKIDQELETKQDTITEKKKFIWTKDKILLAIIFTIIILISIALLIIIIVDEEFLFKIVRDYFIKPIIGLHIALQVLIFLGLMIIQSLFAPIPSELILLSGGMIFGLAWGSVIGLVGSMLSAIITFYLSKRGGRSIIDASGEKVGIIKRTIYIFDEWITKWGLWAIIVGRAVPVIMFDPISYAAGLANVKDRDYFLATFIGSIPRAIFYAWLGVRTLGSYTVEEILTLPAAEIKELAGEFNMYFFIIFGILIAMFVISNLIYYIRERKKKKINFTTENDTANEIEIFDAKISGVVKDNEVLPSEKFNDDEIEKKDY
ncbi:MAG: TVP38/TMEM64 family protein [Candidatus Heimdallarchaeota archaeon]|nr:TVP38/TMEM64 family protein [Candidatus Heimdallarchaeota archaeon]